jgi:hypothetical protein
MTIRNLTAATLLLSAVTAAPALAGETEIIGIANSARNDSTYGSVSLRYSFGPSLDEGLKLRADAARTSYDFIMGQTSVTGTVNTVHMLLGYAIKIDDIKLTFYGGLSQRDRSHDPFVQGVTDESGVAGFTSVEMDTVLANGTNAAALAEYDGVFGTLYTGGYIVMPLGSVKIGPTANYVSEGDYTRSALGIRLQAPISDSFEAVLTGAYAQGGVDDQAKVNSSYIEVQISTRF